MMMVMTFRNVLARCHVSRCCCVDVDVDPCSDDDSDVENIEGPVAAPAAVLTPGQSFFAFLLLPTVMVCNEAARGQHSDGISDSSSCRCMGSESACGDAWAELAGMLVNSGAACLPGVACMIMSGDFVLL